MCDTKSSFFLLYSLPYTLGYNSQSTDLQPNQPKHSSLSDDGRSDHPLHGRHPRDDWRLSTILCSEGSCVSALCNFKHLLIQNVVPCNAVLGAFARYGKDMKV
ncbi:unnamed protein product [Rhodiola kirilowii]